MTPRDLFKDSAVEWIMLAIAIVCAALVFAGCATVRPDYYTPRDCLTLREKARTAGSVSDGSRKVAMGLAAGSALAEAVADSTPLTIGVALGAVLSGALGLGADAYEKSATKEWDEACALMPMPVAPGVASH